MGQYWMQINTTGTSSAIGVVYHRAADSIVIGAVNQKKPYFTSGSL